MSETFYIFCAYMITAVLLISLSLASWLRMRNTNRRIASLPHHES